MILQDFSSDTWASLKDPDPNSLGFPSTALTLTSTDPSTLHLFRDRKGLFHLAIEAPETEPKNLLDPNVNGLKIQLIKYRFQNGQTSRFIDITCCISGYLEEFTEVVREIASEILENKIIPAIAVKTVVNKWLAFWGKASKEALSEKDQVGLICELLVLEKLCSIDPEKALQSWKGPIGEKHDFSLHDWSFEVKGTRKSSRIHTINGIEQLVRPHGKKLGFFSFQISKTKSTYAFSLFSLIESIKIDHFTSRPDLILLFQELLRGAGYSPLHKQIYLQIGFELVDGLFHEVDDGFPKITPNTLNESLSPHVSKIKYDISLEGIAGQDFRKLKIEQFFNRT